MKKDHATRHRKLAAKQRAASRARTLLEGRFRQYSEAFLRREDVKAMLSLPVASQIHASSRP